MAEPKTHPTDASVPEFLAAQPPARQADCERLVAIMTAATGQPPVLWGSAIVGFGAYAIGSGAKAAEWPVVAFSPRKTELVVYLPGGFAIDAAAGTLAALGAHRLGKGCLYLKRLADVDETVLAALVADAVGAAPPRTR